MRGQRECLRPGTRRHRRRSFASHHRLIRFSGADTPKPRAQAAERIAALRSTVEGAGHPSAGFSRAATACHVADETSQPIYDRWALEQASFPNHRRPKKIRHGADDRARMGPVTSARL